VPAGLSTHDTPNTYSPLEKGPGEGTACSLSNGLGRIAARAGTGMSICFCKEQNMKMKLMDSLTIRMLAITSLLSLQTPRAEAADLEGNRSTTARVIVNKDVDPEKEVVVKVVSDEDEDAGPAKDRAWLGV